MSIRASCGRPASPVNEHPLLRVSPHVSSETLWKILAPLMFIPITYPNKDLQGRTLQLWKYKNSLRGTLIDAEGHIRFFSGKKIRNPCALDGEDLHLLANLESSGLRQWHLGYSEAAGEIYIFPYLTAAGRKGDVDLSQGNKSLIQEFRGRFSAAIEHLKARDLRAAQREIKGEVVKWNRRDDFIKYRGADGKTAKLPIPGIKRIEPYHHWKEVQETQKNLGKRVEELNTLLKSFQNKERGYAQEEFNQTKRLHEDYTHLLRQTYRFVPPDAKPPDGFEKRTPLLLTHTKGGGDSLSTKHFENMLRQTGLMDSYKSSNPQASFSGGGRADIGGVACSPAYIQGLFDPPETLFEREHYFAFPVAGSSPPFSDEELRQILQELAIGIYVHDTIPFFSLHFDRDSNLFPVIHPVYRHTLVGRVISMLDYMMKGYLNGGVFHETFIDDWAKNPHWPAQKEKGRQELIDFQDYCLKELNDGDQSYFSLRTLKLRNLELGESDKPASQTDFSGFRNSFRIIGKQKSYQKEGPLFTVDTDFDVLYTISPPATYQATDGKAAPGYQELEGLFKEMVQRIHDHMPKIPICRRYFEMLSVINFFSAYFSTMKRHRKIPNLLPAISTGKSNGCPTLFPHLPIQKFSQEFIQANFFDLIQSAQRAIQTFGQDIYLSQQAKQDLTALLEINKKALLRQLKMALQSEILKRASRPLRIYFESQNQKLGEIVDKNEDMLRKIVLTIFEFYQKNLAKQKSEIEAQAQKLVVLFEQERQQKITQELHKVFNELWPELLKRMADHNQVKNLYSIRYTVSLLESDLASGEIEIEYGKRVVGGCGLRLKERPLHPSFQGALLLQQQETALQEMLEERWTLLNGVGSSFATLRLSFDELSPGEANDYSWMRDWLSPEAEMTTDSVELLSAFDDPSSLKLLIEKGLQPDRPDSDGYTPIHLAAMHGSQACVQLLLQKEPRCLNVKSVQGLTPLLVAIEHNQLSVAQLLVANGAAWTVTREGYNPLHVALQLGHLEMTELLLTSPHLRFFINEDSEEGGTPLMLASALDNPDLVEALIAKGANAAYQTKTGQSATRVALRRKCLPVLKVLCQQERSTSESIHFACAEGSVEIIEIMRIQANTPTNASGDTALHTSLLSGNLRVALHLIKNRPSGQVLDNPNHQGVTPMQLALRWGFWEVIDLLAAQGIPFFLIEAMRLHYHPLLKKLVQNEEYSQKELQAALERAIRCRNYEAISQVLIPKGADIYTFQDAQGRRLIHYLAASDGIHLFKEWLSKRMEDLTLIHTGKTLLYIAAENRSHRIFSYLLGLVKEKRASLQPKGAFHPLQAVAESGDKELFDELVTSFPDQNLPNHVLDDRGTRASHIAARKGHKALFDLLKAQGAEAAATDRSGKSAHDYAIENGHAALFSKELEGAALSSESLLKLAEEANLLLLQSAIQLPHTQKNYDHSLILAAQYNSKLAFIRLWGAGKPSEKSVREAFLIVSRRGHFELLEFMLMQNPTLAQTSSGEEFNPVAEAEKNGQTRCALRLQGKDFPKSKYQLSIEADNWETVTLKLFQALSQRPFNEELEVVVFGQSWWGTPLQLLFQIHAKKEALDLIELNKEKIDPNRQDSNGNTLAHLLLLHQIDPTFLTNIDFTKKNYQDQTLAHLAAKKMPTETLEAIFRENPDLIHAKDRQGRAPLVYSLEADSTENLVYLIEKRGVELTPELLLACCKKGKINHARVLIEHGLIPDPSCLQNALQQENEKLVHLLLEYGVKVDQPFSDGSSPLHLGARSKDLRLLRLLVAKGAIIEAIDSRGFQPIHIAAQQGNSEAVEELAELQGEGIDVCTQKGETPLHLSALHGQTETVERELLLGADPEKKTTQKQDVLSFSAAGQRAAPTLELFLPYKFSQELDRLGPALVQAIRNDNLDAMVALYNRGISCISSLITGLNITGLHIASESGALLCTQWLLEQGVDPHLQNHEGETAYTLAAVNRSSEQFRLLLEYSDWNRKKEERLLHLATQANNLQHVLILILMGVEIDARDLRGNTALHIAIKHERKEMTRLLLCLGADFALPDQEGMTPQIRRPEWKQLFEEAMKQSDLLLRSVEMQCLAALLFHSQAEAVFDEKGKGSEAIALAESMGLKKIHFLLLQQKSRF